MSKVFTAYIEYDEDTEQFVGTVPGLPGAHSQGRTLDELHTNLHEVLSLIIEERRAKGEPLDIDPFVGIQQVVVRL